MRLKRFCPLGQQTVVPALRGWRCFAAHTVCRGRWLLRDTPSYSQKKPHGGWVLCAVSHRGSNTRAVTQQVHLFTRDINLPSPEPRRGHSAVRKRKKKHDFILVTSSFSSSEPLTPLPTSGCEGVALLKFGGFISVEHLHKIINAILKRKLFVCIHAVFFFFISFTVFVVFLCFFFKVNQMELWVWIYFLPAE